MAYANSNDNVTYVTLKGQVMTPIRLMSYISKIAGDAI